MPLFQTGLQILCGCLGLFLLIQSSFCGRILIPSSQFKTHRKAIGKGVYQTITCEKAIWDNRRACPPGLKIGKILDAKYGRHLGGDICPYGGYFVDDPPCANHVLPLESCIEKEDDDARSLKGQEDLLDDSPCHFVVGDKAMRGNPCPSTYKYLAVVFTCVKPDY